MSTGASMDEVQAWEEVKHAEHEADEDYITPETRRAVLVRDRWRCRHCGDQHLDALTLHHVSYRSHGGGHGEDNLVTLCWDCHNTIHRKTLRVLRIDGVWYFGKRDHWRNRL